MKNYLDFLFIKGFFLFAFLPCLSISLSSCGRGGAEGGNVGGGSPSLPPQTIVSGIVQAPNSQIASFQKPGILTQIAYLVLSKAEAIISGISNVPDGTVVELDRINDQGSVILTLATTVTKNGSYSFNFTQMKINFDSALIVRVANSENNAQMRAFVGIGLTNINPSSEASVRNVLNLISSNKGLSLSNFTPQEENDIMASIDLLSTVKQVTAGPDIETSVAAVQNAVIADTSVTNFIVSASAAGQTGDGPGDVGNYFPFTLGDTWYFNSSDSTVSSPSTFLITDSYTGTKSINGVETIIQSETRSYQSGIASLTYLVKNNLSISVHGLDLFSILNQVLPIELVEFPLQPGRYFGQINKNGLDYGSDLDGDGINETFSINVNNLVVGFETVNVPVGTFNNAVKIENIVTLTIKLSGSGKTLREVSTIDNWYASGIGNIKYRGSSLGYDINGNLVFQSQGSQDLTGNIIDNVGQGLNIHITAPYSTLTIGGTAQLSAQAYDQASNPIYGLTYGWKSSNSNVANVSSSGLVTGISPGQSVITSSVDGIVSNPISFNVIPSRVQIASTVAAIGVGSQIQLTATSYDQSNNSISGLSYNWSSNNPSVAVVDSNGLVTGIGQGGATITATFPGSSLSNSINIGISLPTLTVINYGSGTGVVTSSPAGINCGANCIYNFAKNTSLSLTAIPSTGSSFVSWLGGGCGNSNPCSVTADSPKSVVAIFNSSKAPTVINVPLDTATIQNAISSAVNGDIISVAPGLYKENINFLGKAVLLLGLNGPLSTVIDGNLNNPVVTFGAGEGLNSILSGFTLQNGYGTFQAGYHGGGVSIKNSSPTVLSNIIAENTACANGMGIAIDYGSPTIQSNLIVNNGGINECSGATGGGIYIYGFTGSPLIIGNTISNNIASSDGGGISLFSAGYPIIQNNFISSNGAGGNGGGISMANASSPLVIQNLIYGNSAAVGGGIYWLIPAGALPILTNNTISENSGSQGSAIYANGFNSNIALTNNIIIGKSGQIALYCDNFNSPPVPILRNNDIYSPQGLSYGGICSDQTGINGNLSSEPLFKSSLSGNYRLSVGSPAIDAGTNNASSLPTTDIVGNNRILDGNLDGISIIDMGAFEFNPNFP